MVKNAFMSCWIEKLFKDIIKVIKNKTKAKELKRSRVQEREETRVQVAILVVLANEWPAPGKDSGRGGSSSGYFPSGLVHIRMEFEENVFQGDDRSAISKEWLCWCCNHPKKTPLTRSTTICQGLESSFCAQAPLRGLYLDNLS